MPAIGTPRSGPVDDLAVHLARRHDARQQRARDRERFEQLVVPRRASPGRMSCVRLAFVTSVTCRPPCAPPVRFQTSQLSIVPNSSSPALRALRARRATLSSSHLQFQAAEVAGERQAGARAKAVLAALAGIERDQRIDARVLPHERVVDRPPAAVPDDGGLALVRDADRGQVARRELRALQARSQ